MKLIKEMDFFTQNRPMLLQLEGLTAKSLHTVPGPRSNGAEDLMGYVSKSLS